MRLRFPLIPAVACTLGLIAPSAHADAASSRLDLLGWLPLGGVSASNAHAINNSGQVVGGSTDRFGNARPYRYTDGTGMINLGDLPGSPSNIITTDINGSGEVVGWAPVGGEIGFRYRDATGMSQVGSFGNFTRIHAINDSGTATGYTFVNGLGHVGFTQVKGEGFSPFGNNSTVPLAINSGGTVTGYSQQSSLDRAFVFSPGGSMTFLPVPAGSNRAYGRDVNDAGQVVGDTLNNALSNTGAFMWSSTTGTQRLQSPVGALATYADGINNVGWIVGHTDGSSTRGILWLPGQTPMSLTDYVQTVLGRPDITILTAEDINDFGQIVGTAQVGSVFEAYRLTIPSPATVFAFGVFSCPFFRRCRPSRKHLQIALRRN